MLLLNEQPYQVNGSWNGWVDQNLFGVEKQSLPNITTGAGMVDQYRRFCKTEIAVSSGINFTGRPVGILVSTMLMVVVGTGGLQA